MRESTASPTRGFPLIAKTCSSRGFTLIEILVVVAIVGVIALVVTLSVTGSGDIGLKMAGEACIGLTMASTVNDASNVPASLCTRHSAWVMPSPANVERCR